jgi:hypothetical protein
MGSKSQIPIMLASPDMEAKSQLLSLNKPLKCRLHPLRSYLDCFMQKKFGDLWSKLGIAFILNTSSKPHLQKVLPHVRIHVILGT